MKSPKFRSTRVRVAAQLLSTGTLLILMSAVIVQHFGQTEEVPHHTAPFLANELPADLPGWTGRVLQLAETEELKKATLSSLQFDDYVSRAYSRNGQIVSVYAAYWQPNKIPPRLVGVHTPDTCWVQSGWKCNERQRSVGLTLEFGHQLKPAEFGAYSFDGATQYVYFWHLVGGQPYAYVQQGAPSIYSIWAQLPDLQFGLHQKREQFFIRVASNQPWPLVWKDPGIKELFASLGRIALAEHNQQ